MTEVLDSQAALEHFLQQAVAICDSGDFAPELQRVAEENAGLLGQYMAQSRSPDGTPYQPLKRPRRTGHNQQSGPLIDFGDLLLSLLGEGSGAIEQTGPRELVQGTGHEKATPGGEPAAIAAIHHYGAPLANIPARPFVGWSAEMEAGAERIIVEGLAARVREL